MLLFSLAIIVGIIFLVLSADKFVAGSAAIANNFGVPHIIIGVTIVSLGTSAPEIIAALFAALEGRVEMAIGNAVGSNIANIGLVLGVTALIAPIPVSQRLRGNETVILLFVTLLAGVLLMNLTLGFVESLFLVVALAAFLLWIYQQHRPTPVAETTEAPADSEDFDDEIPSDLSTPMALGYFVGGLIVLIGSARVLLWGATGIADTYGISEAVIGATIIAVGTSLPELAASVASALKKHHDIAIGNVLGSNIFNLLAVLPLPGLIAPSLFKPEVFYLHFMAALAFTVVLVIALIMKAKRQALLGRYLGTIFVLSYAAYGFLAYQSA